MSEVSSECRSCGAIIFWAVTEASVVQGEVKRMPVDFLPEQEGNVEMVGRQEPSQTPVVRVYSQAPLMPTGDLYFSHFMTCPKADDWRAK